MDRSEKIGMLSTRIGKWLSEVELHLTMENIRRYFALKYGKLPSEQAISDIYEILVQSTKGGE